MPRRQRAGLWGLALLALLVVSGCAGARPYTLGPVKTFDPDTAAIPKPEDAPEYDLWDRVDMTLFYPLEKPLDLGWTGRQIGRAMGLADKREADNVNVLGEVPNSSWYTRRHYYHPMTLGELAQGPNTGTGPSGGPWTVVSGKLEGASPGFVIEDDRGDRYLLKFGRPPYHELSSAAEVISTKILYAAGYFVPENYVTYFDPGKLAISPDARVRTEEGQRPMRPEDLEVVLDGQPRERGGRVRALASKYVEGAPVGIWEFRGTREDDPNDRVFHQHRRELRGLRVLSAWLNDADRRSANTLAVYTDDRYIRHYLIDMGSTLGANGARPHSTKHGYEYLYDPRYIAKSFIGLGFYDRPWLFIDRDEAIEYPSVGYFESELFNPETWVPVYPNPAFDHMTLRDAFWGAKLVMSFSDEELEAIVKTGDITNPDAEAELLRVLKERRDKIGRHFFGRINPLDRFELFRTSSGGLTLTFDDLAVEGALEPAAERSYLYAVCYDGRQLYDEPRIAGQPRLTFSQAEASSEEAASGASTCEHLVAVKIQTRGEDGALSKPLTVYGYVPGAGEKPRVVGVHREDD